MPWPPNSSPRTNNPLLLKGTISTRKGIISNQSVGADAPAARAVCSTTIEKSPANTYIHTDSPGIGLSFSSFCRAVEGAGPYRITFSLGNFQIL